MNIVIVSGPEAAGKTYVGRELAKLLGYHYLSKDMIKEAMFDSEPHSTWDFKWYEKRAKDVFFDTLKKSIAHHKSVIIESNFIDDDKKRLSGMIGDRIIVTEIHCTAKGLTTFWRFMKRNESGVRHKGHHDRRWYLWVLGEDLLKYIHIEWPHKPVGITSRLMVLDSTNFSRIDYTKILNFIKQA